MARSVVRTRFVRLTCTTPISAFWPMPRSALRTLDIGVDRAQNHAIIDEEHDRAFKGSSAPAFGRAGFHAM